MVIQTPMIASTYTARRQIVCRIYIYGLTSTWI